METITYLNLPGRANLETKGISFQANNKKRERVYFFWSPAQKDQPESVFKWVSVDRGSWKEISLSGLSESRKSSLAAFWKTSLKPKVKSKA